MVSGPSIPDPGSLGTRVQHVGYSGQLKARRSLCSRERAVDPPPTPPPIWTPHLGRVGGGKDGQAGARRGGRGGERRGQVTAVLGWNTAPHSGEGVSRLAPGRQGGDPTVRCSPIPAWPRGGSCLPSRVPSRAGPWLSLRRMLVKKSDRTGHPLLLGWELGWGVSEAWGRN